MDPDIIVDDLSYTYLGQKTPCLKKINFTVNRGDFVLIAGPTGCGKSTLVYCLNGLIPHVFEGELFGKVIVDGKNTRDFEVYQLAQSVGAVFQNPESQLCSLIVEDEVAFGPENLALSRDEIRKRVSFALEATNINDFIQKYVFNLSAGQKQRVVIASTLALLPKILVLDEPLSELDPIGCREMLQTLKKLNRDLGMSIVMTEHKLEEVLGVVKRALIMDEGQIVAQGEPYEVFKDVELIERLGLRVPEIVKFGYKLVQEGIATSLPLSMGEIDSAISKLSELLRRKAPNPDKRDLKCENNISLKPLARAENLFYIYDDGTTALNGVNLGVSSGEFVAILGCNGAGKSTLAQVMTGLLKPARGKMFIDGRDITKCSASEIAETIGYTFQNPENQLFCDSVKDEVAFGPRQLNLLKKDVDDRVQNALQVMGLTRLEDRYPQALSRGQRLRVAIASVLSMKPKVLILDEPMAAQDFNQIASLMNHLKLLNSRGLSVVMITHDINVTARYVNRVVLMAKGQVIADGKPREVLSNGDLLVRGGLSLPTAISLSKYIGLPPMMSIDELNRAVWGT